MHLWELLITMHAAVCSCIVSVTLPNCPRQKGSSLWHFISSTPLPIFSSLSFTEWCWFCFQNISRIRLQLSVSATTSLERLLPTGLTQWPLTGSSRPLWMFSSPFSMLQPVLEKASLSRPLSLWKSSNNLHAFRIESKILWWPTGLSEAPTYLLFLPSLFCIASLFLPRTFTYFSTFTSRACCLSLCLANLSLPFQVKQDFLGLPSFLP